MQDIVLTPAQIEQFKNALLGAFDRGDLEQVILFGLGELFEHLTAQDSLDHQVTKIVVWANAHNRIGPLLAKARELNSGNAALRDFEAALHGSVPAAANGQPGALPAAGATFTTNVQGGTVGNVVNINNLQGPLNIGKG